jgi:hypothetical protein
VHRDARLYAAQLLCVAVSTARALIVGASWRIAISSGLCESARLWWETPASN